MSISVNSTVWFFKSMKTSDKCLVTGGAGFIGYHLANRLIMEQMPQLVIDNFDPYYDINLKKARVSQLENYAKKHDLSSDIYQFKTLDLKEKENVVALLKDYRPKVICHLAAQAGVRYSIENPHTYIDNNISATINLLEAARLNNVKDFVLASTSSVYGVSKDMPFTETLPINTTISTYSATKHACELLCHVYHHLYGIRFRILRFFTVYGPWGRPDMALFLFTKSILDGDPIKVYNNGDMRRDFTYVGDIVDGFFSAIKSPLEFEVINLGCGKPVELMKFIEVLEKNLEQTAIKDFHPMQLGDVHETSANISKAYELLGYNPKVSIDEGIKKFIEWYREYYHI